MSSSNTSPRVSSPGIALSALLRNATKAKLAKIVGQPAIELLDGFGTDLATGTTLGDFAANLIDPLDALRNQTARDEIIRLLPLTKARELAARLNVELDSRLYGNLCTAASEKPALPALLSFFGVVREQYASDDTTHLTHVSPQYGLFGHQTTIAQKVSTMITRARAKLVVHMPTGSGKTRTAMHIICSHLNALEPTVVCWLAQNAELLDQASEEFETAWSHLGRRKVELLRFWGQRRKSPLSLTDGVLVAGLGKLRAFDQRHPNDILALADRVSLVILDEAHQAIAPTYASVVSTLHTKRLRTALIGLTATPGRTWSDIEEDKRLAEFFDGEKVTLQVQGYADPIAFLISEGYLARPTFRTLNARSGLTLSAADVGELSHAIEIPSRILRRLGEDTQRNLRILAATEDLLTRHRRVLAFAPSVMSARLLSSALEVRGHDASVVTADTPANERKRIVRRFRSDSGGSLVLCNYDVLTTGFDVPSVSAAVIARPTRSLVLYSQMVGRATRGPRAGGNTAAEIVTVVDPALPGFRSVADAFKNWEDVWHDPA